MRAAPRRVLVVGTGPRARRLAKALGRQSPPVEIAGFVDSDPLAVDQGELGAPVLGAPADIGDILGATIVDEVLVAVPRAMLAETEKLVRACVEEGVRVRVLADVFDVRVKRLSLERAGDLPLLTFDAVAHDAGKLVVKRAIDVIIGGAALVALAPVMAVVAVAIKLDSRGPIFFVQDRVGLDGRTFRLIKFRSMVPDAEQRQAGLEHLNEVGGPAFKIRRDPRVTRVGRILRRASLDEIPQFLNVVLGDMSLVGPRPLPLRDVRRFGPGAQRRRFKFKPGLTGLWQVSGRSELSFAEWLRLDLWYIDHWSIALDLRILLRSVSAVLRGTGAV